MHIKKLTTFIDQRYGDGAYLKNIRFEQKTNNPSFCWYNLKTKDLLYRQSKGFEGNKGYEKGYIKIWDCGQARWDLEIN